MSKIAGKRILVTGGTGFIGGRLVEELVLRYGAQVRVLVRNFARAARVARLPVEMVGGDVTDIETVLRVTKDCDAVFHCAYGSSGVSGDRRAATVEGTRNVARAVLENGLSRMIHMSTISVYGNTAPGDLNENSPRSQTGNLYGDTKLEAETLVLDQCKKQGLPASIIQPTIVYGPYAPWTVGPISELKTGKVVLTNRGAGFCNAVYVDDVIQAMILAAECEAAIGECFLISDKEPVTWRKFYEALQLVLGVDALVEMSPDEIKFKSRPTLKQKMRKALQSIRMQSKIINNLAQSPILKQPYRFLRNLNKKVQETAGALRPSRSNSKRFYFPDEILMNFYESKTYVRIDKAHKILGYSPLYDFNRGMELTAEWIRWANLT